eukprot:652793-Amphidinium_carterae.1
MCAAGIGGFDWLMNHDTARGQHLRLENKLSIERVARDSETAPLAQKELKSCKTLANLVGALLCQTLTHDTEVIRDPPFVNVSSELAPLHLRSANKPMKSFHPTTT